MFLLIFWFNNKDNHEANSTRWILSIKKKKLYSLKNINKRQPKKFYDKIVNTHKLRPLYVSINSLARENIHYFKCVLSPSHKQVRPIREMIYLQYFYNKFQVTDYYWLLLLRQKSNINIDSNLNRQQLIIYNLL